MATYRNINKTQIRYRINHQIIASEVRLIDEEAKQIGVMSLAEARQMSQESGLDLVEIAPNAKPPVVKLIEFSKFKYQESKKAKSEKKGIKGGETKEIQMTPFIGQADYDTRVKKAKEFLTTGNKVKLSIKFQGRQITRKEFGFNLVNKFQGELADISSPEGEAKFMGKRLIFTLTPSKKKNSSNNQNESAK